MVQDSPAVQGVRHNDAPGSPFLNGIPAALGAMRLGSVRKLLIGDQSIRSNLDGSGRSPERIDPSFANGEGEREKDEQSAHAQIISESGCSLSIRPTPFVIDAARKSPR